MPDIAAGSRPTPAQSTPCEWDGERLFQAAKFGTEMQYQHLVFEEFARTVQPQVDAFLAPTGYDTDHRPGDRRRVRAYRLSLRPLDAARDGRSPRSQLQVVERHPTRARPDRGLPQPAGVRRQRPDTRAGGRRHRARRHAPGRQRDRRVRDRGAAQQPARPAARPRRHQLGARPRHRHSVAERGAPRILRR